MIHIIRWEWWPNPGLWLLRITWGATEVEDVA